MATVAVHWTRELNLQLRRSSGPRSDLPIPFVCEYGQPGCGTTAWLTPDEFDEALATDTPIVCAGHDRPDGAG